MKYQPVILGFIIDVGLQNIRAVSTQIVEAIQRLDGDEWVYIYQPGNRHIPRWIGESVAAVANYVPVEFLIGDAIKGVVDLFSELDDLRKYIFVITDNYQEVNRHRMKTSIRADLKGISDPCSFYLYGLGHTYKKSLASLCEFHPACVFKHFDDASFLSQTIKKAYQREIAPFFIDNFKSIDREQIVKDYEEIKNGKDQNGEIPQIESLAPSQFL